jgi:3-deoxy-D-manno-octulosonic-acid transferase
VPLPELLYESVVILARPVLRVVALFNEEVRQAVRGRQESWLRFLEWAWLKRVPDRPLIWVHAPSVGEALMAQAVIAQLRARLPGMQAVFTHFSPSAERMVKEVGADVAGYLPWDTRWAMRAILGAFRPSVVVFVRTEIWPVLTREAVRAGVPLVMINAVLAEESGRLSGPARAFLQPAYRRLSGVGAVSPEHGDRYRRLGVSAERIRVTGDARFDQVWDRIEARGLFELRGEPDAHQRVPEPLRPVWRLLDDPGTFTVVAGSTWPEDERVVLPPITVLRRGRRIRLIIAPHEPTPAHLTTLERRLDDLSLRHARLGPLLAGSRASTSDEVVSDRAPPEIVVVDRMGLLADLYALAAVAYVGGGFGTAGLHSVVEPAALGVPVLSGPAPGKTQEAAELAATGGGFVVRSAGDIEERLRTFADEPGTAPAAGVLAREFVRSETGSAARNATLVMECTWPGGRGTQRDEHGE